jgi:uncharacterized protein (DUF427 family)
MTEIPSWLKSARSHWQWTGQRRPDFAQPTVEGEESVWDYPRPPAIVPDSREVLVRWSGREIARTRAALRVLETGHPPSFYLPLREVRQALLRAAGSGSFCEWKGPASYWTLEEGNNSLERVAWSYAAPLAGAEIIADHIAFYPGPLECFVDGVRVLAQPGGFYGGWITQELKGPFKGARGTENW